MSWHYLQGQEEACWPHACLDGAPNALWNLMPLLEGSSSPDSATDTSTGSLSGTTSRPSMAAPDRRRREEFWQTFVQPEQHSPRRPFLDGRSQRWPDDPADGQVEPFVGRVISDDVAAGVDRCSRLRAIGNGQVPAVARLAWNILRGLR